MNTPSVPRRRSSGPSRLIVLVVILLLVPVVLVVYGVIVMVAFGLLHGVFPEVPPIGFRPSMAVGTALALLGWVIRGGTNR